MKVLSKYKLASVRDGVAFIDVNGKVNGKGDMNQSGMKIELDMDGEQKGNFNIGIDDGYLKDSQVSMDIKADMAMMGQKIPLILKAYYLIKGK